MILRKISVLIQTLFMSLLALKSSDSDSGSDFESDLEFFSDSDSDTDSASDYESDSELFWITLWTCLWFFLFRLQIINSRLSFSAGYYSAPNFFLQFNEFELYWGVVFLLWSVQTFSWFLKSNSSSDFGHAEIGKGAKKRVVLRCEIFSL